MSPATTDVQTRTILITFQNVPFKSLDNNLFSQFLTQVTSTSSQTFGLGGLANSKPFYILDLDREVDWQSSCDSSRFYCCWIDYSSGCRFLSFNRYSWTSRFERTTYSRFGLGCLPWIQWLPSDQRSSCTLQPFQYHSNHSRTNYRFRFEIQWSTDCKSRYLYHYLIWEHVLIPSNVGNRSNRRPHFASWNEYGPYGSSLFS